MTKQTNKEYDEAKRMFMQLIEEDAYVDISEDVKYPPVAISCGSYTDTDFTGENY